MIKIENQDILLETRGILVHGCNMQLVMNNGIAKQIRAKYPQAYVDYSKALSKTKKPLIGSVIYTKIDKTFYIANALTQLNYGNSEFTKEVYVDYDALESAFISINTLALKTKLPVIFPKIGCGLAGGDWNMVQNIIEKTLDPSITKTLFVL